MSVCMYVYTHGMHTTAFTHTHTHVHTHTHTHTRTHTHTHRVVNKVGDDIED